MKNDNAVPQTAEEVGTQVSGKRAQLAQMLEQASTLPNNEAPKVTGRKRLKKTTKDTEQEDRARIDQVLSEQAIPDSMPVVPGAEVEGNKLRADVIEVNGSPIMLLKQQYSTPEGQVLTVFPRLTDGFSYQDAATGIARHYRMVKWHADLRQQGDELGFDVWLNSLAYHGQQGDGLWVREDRPEEPEDTKGKKKKGGGGGRGTWETISTNPCYIKSIVIDERNSHFLEVERCNMYGVWATVRIGLDQLHDNGQGPIWKELSRTGMPMSNKETQRFRQMALDYVAMATGNAEKYIKQGRNKPGWHLITDGQGTRWEYITSGFSTSPQIPFTGSNVYPWKTSGNRELYLRRMAKLLRENPVVAILAGFSVAGLFLQFIKNAVDFNPTMIMLGTSTLGKTFASHILMSFRGYSPLLIKVMAATPNALLKRAGDFNQSCVIFDEIGACNLRGEEKPQFVYTLASGDEKARLQKNPLSGTYENNANSERTYQTVIITGEKELITLDGATTGNNVRLTQVVYSKEQNPVWHGITKGEDAEEWKAFIHENYGWIYPEIVHLIKNNIDTPREYFTRFSTILAKQTDTDQQRRKSHAWAVAMAGVQFISDVIGKVQDEDGQWIDGFTAADVDTALQHAKRLMKLEMDDSPIEKEDAGYWNFVTGFATRFASDMYVYRGEMLEQSAKGNPRGLFRTRVTHDVKQGGQVKEYELCILKDSLEKSLPANMDKKRMLNFFKDAKVLMRSEEKDKVRGIVYRDTVTEEIIKSCGKEKVYKFVWTERLTDEIDMD